MSLSMFKKNKNKVDSKQSTNQPKAKEPSLIDTIDINSVSKARNWVASLPVMDMGETTRRLFVGLTKLNNEPISPQTRVDVTEILLPYVRMALENLDRHFLSRSFPLPVRSQKVFDLKKSLIMELAGSYQLAALDMLTKDSGSKKSLLISIGRAIQYMSVVIINDYSIYAKNKKSIWHDIHHLYLLACEKNIQTKEVPHKDDANGENLSIEEQYKLINLVALSVPNTLRQGEIARIREFFLENLNDVKLISSPEKVKSKYAHITLLNSDEPASLMPVADLLNSPTSRIFDLSSVIHKIDQFVTLSETDELGKHVKWPMLTHSLAKRLVYVLTTIRNRRYKRFEREEKASLVIRMSDVINIIRDNEPESFMDQINEDVEDDNIYQALAAEDEVSSPWSDVDVEELATNRDVTTHSWQIENSSSGGYGLKQVVSEATTARVGELVAIKDPKDTNDMWQVSVTRWMDSFKDVGLRIGLEILSLHGMVVKVDEITTRDISQKLPLEGVLLPTIDGARDEANLIFPGYIFHVDDELTITLGSRQQSVKITNIDDTVGNFSYCNFEILDVEELPEGSLEAFDDVWEFL